MQTDLWSDRGAAYFGIRHHGPGSARRLVEALDALRPTVVLIEGPSDLTPLLPMLASEAMVPPVALLAYPADDPGAASFWPFAVFSPEYQAARWAVAAGVPVRFIDLPVAWRHAPAEPGKADAGAEPDEASAGDEAAPDAAVDEAERDPIGLLARAAGYEDGESFWRDVIEENPEPGEIFEAVADAMTALRGDGPPPDRFEARREAHMRLEIASAVKASDGPVAVVCGAWHVPALRTWHAAKDDRALLKGAPRRRIAATWAPWTSPRLAVASGYGAGVVAPGWCRHLWESPRGEIATRWLARTAWALRSAGHLVSTASLIEAERLAVALSALRGKPQPGFEELREATVACLMGGQTALWSTIADPLLVGTEVGSIPDDVPLAPLLDDLARQQKTARLKPEALDRELSLDLRSESGLFRSTLLHRLDALGVGWGELQDPGRSRGTFRERWVLRWEPEHAVALVENLVYGPTIEKAAAGRLAAQMGEAHDLGRLAELVLQAMTAQLPDASARGIALIGERAGVTGDGLEMLAALPPLADVVRYGKARATATDQLAALFDKIAVQAALALGYAVRNLDAEAAAAMRAAVEAADGAVRLLGSDALADWNAALATVSASAAASRLVAGLATRLLYESEAMSSEDAVAHVARMLSPGTPIADAAAYFAGFFEGAGQRLLFDADLRACVDGWLTALEAEAFTAHLPLFRRVFGRLDRTERRRLMDVLFGAGGSGLRGLRPATDAETRWPAHHAMLTALLKKGAPDGR
ncbi:hypothetical protein DLJ53_09590 [Acuticoccus sediminis]|uniref:Uncharacterized protein n=1 Tax=Acuticoccus sediminis TaxID=2184697 RepID=A0A8B2P068_9HYPH|nr:DUF5682 family protein [Acuticoccus sediminis]RAI01657.1 hypothetical protein DLJ53_09590 [Acuticoccus sediminis]